MTKCGVWADMVDVCAIFGDCRLRGVGVVRGVILPSPLTTLDTLPRDRVILSHIVEYLYGFEVYLSLSSTVRIL